jgi:hypothetical protein
MTTGRSYSAPAPARVSNCTSTIVFNPGSRSDALIDQNRVSVRVHGNKAAGPGRILIRLVHQHDALGLQLARQIANVGEGAELVCVDWVTSGRRLRPRP